MAQSPLLRAGLLEKSRRRHLGGGQLGVCTDNASCEAQDLPRSALSVLQTEFMKLILLSSKRQGLQESELKAKVRVVLTFP